MIVGLISDTHGLLRPDVHRAFEGVELILHAGDIGGDEILMELELIAPVRAVFGNTDQRNLLGVVDAIDDEIAGLRVHVSHGHELGVPKSELLLAAYDADVIIYGHTHRQRVDRGPAGQLVVNPGAAGHRRFDLKPSVALLTIADGRADAEIVPLAE
jgi:putative phosphoesterase